MAAALQQKKEDLIQVVVKSDINTQGCTWREDEFFVNRTSTPADLLPIYAKQQQLCPNSVRFFVIPVHEPWFRIPTTACHLDKNGKECKPFHNIRAVSARHEGCERCGTWIGLQVRVAKMEGKDLNWRVEFHGPWDSKKQPVPCTSYQVEFEDGEGKTAKFETQQSWFSFDLTEAVRRSGGLDKITGTFAVLVKAKAASPLAQPRSMVGSLRISTCLLDSK